MKLQVNNDDNRDGEEEDEEVKDKQRETDIFVLFRLEKWHQGWTLTHSDIFVLFTVRPPLSNECPGFLDMTLTIWRWSSSNALRNAEYLFVALTPRSTEW